MPTKKEASDRLLAAIEKKNWILAASLIPGSSLSAQDKALDLLFLDHQSTAPFSPAGPAPQDYATGNLPRSDSPSLREKNAMIEPLLSAKNPAPKNTKHADPANNQLSFDFREAVAQTQSTRNKQQPFFDAMLPAAPGEESARDFARLAAQLIKSLGDKAARRDAYSFLIGDPTQRRARSLVVSERNARVAAWIAEDGGLIRAPAYEIQNLDWTHVSMPAVRSFFAALSFSGNFETSLAITMMGVLARQGHAQGMLEILSDRLERDPEITKKHLDHFGLMAIFSQTRRAGMAFLAKENEWKSIFLSVLALDPALSLKSFQGLIQAHIAPPSLHKPNATVSPNRPFSLPQIEHLLDEMTDLRHFQKTSSAQVGGLLDFLAPLPSNHLDPRAKNFLAKWAVEAGDLPTSSTWQRAARTTPELVQYFLSANLPWPNPAETLAAAATENCAQISGSSLDLLLSARTWSPADRSDAMNQALGQSSLRKEKVDRLIVFSDYTVEQLSDALAEAMGQISISDPADKTSCLSPFFWIDRGATASGSKKDGEPLYKALGTLRNWKSAKILADAGGWGTKAESWLLSPRKKTPLDLKPWIEEAQAIRDAKALRRTLSSVKKEHALEDKKEARLKKQRLTTLSTENPSDSSLSEPPTAFTKKAIRRL